MSDPTSRKVRSKTAQAVLPHAFRILVEEGAHALTPQRLHQESGVARTTIYRNWATTADVLLSLLDQATSTDNVPEFTGEAETDLTIAVDSLTFRFNHRPARAFFAALVEFDRGNEGQDLAAAFVRGMLEPARRAISEASERGDIDVPDLEEALLQLAGPLLTKHIIYGETVTPDDGTRVVQRFVEDHRSN